MKLLRAIAWVFWVLLAAWAAVGLRHLRVSNSLEAWMPDLATPGPYRSYVVIGFPTSRADAGAVAERLRRMPDVAFCVDPVSVRATAWLTGLWPEDFLVSRDGSYSGVFCFARDGADPRHFLKNVQAALTEVAPSYVFAIGGPTAFQCAMDEWSQDRLALILTAIVSAGGVMLLAVTGSLRISAAAIAGIVLSEVIFLGAVCHLNIPLDMSLALVPPMMTGMGVSYAAHRALRRNSVAVLITCGLAAALGIASYATADLKSVRHFALAGVPGLLLVWLVVVTLVFPDAHARRRRVGWLRACRNLALAINTRYRPTIVFAAVVFTAAGFCLAPFLRVESNPLRFFLDPITLVIGSITTGVVVDDMLHLLSTCRRRGSMQRAMIECWKPCVGSSLAAAVCFALFTLSRFGPTAQFGLLMALATLFAMLANQLLLQAVAEHVALEPEREGFSRPAFRIVRDCPNLGCNTLHRQKLGLSVCSPSFPVVPRCGIAPWGQIGDTSVARLQPPSRRRSRLPLASLAFVRERMSRYVRRRRKSGKRGAIYARYSTRFQQSIADQVRECRLWAEQYGAYEAVWQNTQDYSRQFKRDEPLAEITFEHLRIIDDRTWHEAQKKLLEYHRRAGRRAKDGDRTSRPTILSGLCVCEKHPDQQLWVGAANGKYMFCPQCRTDPEPGLVSLLSRRYATAQVLRKVAGLFRSDPDLVRQATEDCVRHAERLQKPDPAELDAKRKEQGRLTREIDFILHVPGETDQNQAENQARLLELRRQRAQVASDIQRMEAAAATEFAIPSQEQVRQLIDRCAKILMAASTSDDEQKLAAARRILEAVTGGRIVIFQQGERKRKRGWLSGTFEVQLDRPVLEELGVSPPEQPKRIVEVDFRKPTDAERLAEDAKKLWDEGLLVKEIARKLSEVKRKKLGRNMVAKALGHWFCSRGLEMPDGRSRRSTLDMKTLDPHLFQKISDNVMELYNTGMLLTDIAGRVGVNIATITAAVRYWHEQRGLPVPDGRSRRKNLERKSRGGKSSGWRAP